eukprot:gene11704-12922_t
MAELLSSQYKKVFSTPKPYANSTPKAQTNITELEFTSEDIKAAIDEIDNSSAAGPDGFPAIFLKKCKEALSTPLCLFWNQCLQNNVIPKVLKHAIITPLHKGGSRSVPANYRPVALTLHLIKIFEKVVRKHMTFYLEENDLLNDNQHGFRAGRSCLSQLLEHYDSILSHMLNGDNVDVIYLDFAKAFDKVDFRIALSKAQRLGIRGNTINFLRAFLTDRTQSVVVNGISSDPCPVLSGVPQGSVLGPLIFLIHIMDIDRGLDKSIARSFADDTRCTRNEHYSSQCMEVVDIKERKAMLLNGKRCFVCLRQGQQARECNSPKKCFNCKGKHNTAICYKGMKSSEKEENFLPSRNNGEYDRNSGIERIIKLLATGCTDMPSEKIKARRYCKTPYHVVERKGTRVIAENNENHRITRNVSHFKKIPDVVGLESSEDEHDAEQNVELQKRPEQVGNYRRRSQRTRSVPVRFGHGLSY